MALGTSFSRRSPNLSTAVALIQECEPRSSAEGIVSRATNILGPINKHRITQILENFRTANRATSPCFAMAGFRTLCNGLRTSQRFHQVVLDRDDLRHFHECSRLAETIAYLWREGGMHTAGSLPRPFCTTFSSVSRATPIVYHDRASNFLHVLRDFSGPLRHWRNGLIIETDTSAACSTRRSKECSCGTRLVDPRFPRRFEAQGHVRSLLQFEKPMSTILLGCQFLWKHVDTT